MVTQTSSPHVPVREAWLAQVREEILEPDLPIVDPHHHLWDRPGARYLFEELLGDTRSGHASVLRSSCSAAPCTALEDQRNYAHLARPSSSPVSRRRAPAGG